MFFSCLGQFVTASTSFFDGYENEQGYPPTHDAGRKGDKLIGFSSPVRPSVTKCHKCLWVSLSRAFKGESIAVGFECTSNVDDDFFPSSGRSPNGSGFDKLRLALAQSLGSGVNEKVSVAERFPPTLRSPVKTTSRST